MITELRELVETKRHELAGSKMKRNTKGQTGPEVVDGQTLSSVEYV